VNISKIHNAIDRLNDRPERIIEPKHIAYGWLFLVAIVVCSILLMPSGEKTTWKLDSYMKPSHTLEEMIGK